MMMTGPLAVQHFTLEFQNLFIKAATFARLFRLLPPANEVWGKVIFSEACVKNFVHGGVPGQVPPGPGTPRTKYTPPDQVHPEGPGTPQTMYTHQDQVPRDQVPPGLGTPPQTRYTLRQVHPPGPGAPQTRYISLGPGTPPTLDQVHPPGAVHAGRYRQQAGGTHPTGMHSCYVLYFNTQMDL